MYINNIKNRENNYQQGKAAFDERIPQQFQHHRSIGTEPSIEPIKQRIEQRGLLENKT
jgi:hypothetical protein